MERLDEEGGRDPVQKKGLGREHEEGAREELEGED